jgi:hypothetical protein
LALGDLNGDRSVDVVTANSRANTVSVLLGQGDGSLAGRQDFPTAENPVSVALADLNGDGRLDIVTASAKSYANGRVSVLLATSDGKFSTHVDYTAGLATSAVAVGDVNNDGKLDIVAANEGADGGWSMSIFLGKGDGTFAAKVDYTSGGGPTSVALGDVNYDGNLDIVTSNAMAGYTVTVMLGKGDGTFPTHTDYETIDYTTEVALGDLNGDGWLDIAVSNGWGNATSIFLGKGDGTFGARADYAPGGQCLALGDLNGDGRLDVVSNSSAGVSTLLGSCQ